MFCFHPTPSHIVENIVRRHSPSNFSSLLEPSIGDGALIKGINTKNKDVTCVDIDSKRLSELISNYANPDFELINSDFLDIDFGERKFDFILCNPPFNGKKLFLIEGKKLPIEAAFLNKALELCHKNGRLIFILPSSVTRGTRLKWFRRKVLSICNLSFSYKLPKFTFSKVEGDFSVLIFDKNSSKKKSVFRTDKSEASCNLARVTSENLSFDADEIIAQKNYYSLISYTPLKYEAVAENIEFARGKITSDYKQNGVIHTTNSAQNLFSNNNTTIFPCVENGDWIINRVSRNLIDSLREYKGQRSPFTDCVIRLRTNNQKSSIIFFALSVMLQSKDVREILVKGCGAKYLDLKSLQNLRIPANLNDLYPRDYERFVAGSDHERKIISKRVIIKLYNLNKQSIDYDKLDIESLVDKQALKMEVG